MSDTATSGMVNFTVSDESGAGKALDRATRLLSGIPGGVEKVAKSALSRAASKGRTGAARQVGKLYHLKASDFNRYTKSYSRITSAAGEITLNVEFRGYHIPLIRFNTRVTASGRVSAQVERSSSAKILEHVFRAEMSSSHIGLFERVRRARLPIEEKLGPSVPQMMGANPALAPAIGDVMATEFENRMEHEILAVMNGWNR